MSGEPLAPFFPDAASAPLDRVIWIESLTPPIHPHLCTLPSDLQPTADSLAPPVHARDDAAGRPIRR